jgi:hypothetical protein
MRRLWKEIVRLKFKGRRFEDHALEISALGELKQFQEIVTETAKELWRTANPTSKYLPHHFEDRTRLYLRSPIQEGSAEVLLEACVTPRKKVSTPDLFEKEFEDIKKAVEFAQQVYESQERDEPLPSDLSQELLQEYTKFGQGLAKDETIELTPAWVRREPVHVTFKTSARLARFLEEKHEDYVDVSGEVKEADVRQNRFQLWLDEKTCVTVKFSPEQEDQVTEALRNHRSVRLQVKGRGRRTPQGKLESVDEISELNLQAIGEIPYDETARPIEEILMELAKEVPVEEWKKLPKDLSENLDHYLYGSPKK